MAGTLGEGVNKDDFRFGSEQQKDEVEEDGGRSKFGGRKLGFCLGAC